MIFRKLIDSSRNYLFLYKYVTYMLVMASFIKTHETDVSLFTSSYSIFLTLYTIIHAPKNVILKKFK